MQGDGLAIGRGDTPAWARAALARLAWTGMVAHAVFLTISMAGMQIGLGVALAGALAVRLAGGRAFRPSPLDLPVLIFAGAAALSVVVAWAAGAPPPNADTATFFRVLLPPLVALAAIEAAPKAEPPERVRARALAFAAVWIAVALLPSAIAWFQSRTGFDPSYALGVRAVPRRAPAPDAPGRFAAMGFFSWYPRFAHAMTPAAMLAGALAALAPLGRRARVALGLAAAGIAWAVVLTGSRSAWAGLAAGAVVVAALAARHVRRVAVPAAVVAALAAALLAPGIRNRIARLDAPEATGDRRVIWGVCSAMIADRPLTGVGFGALPRRAPPYYDRLAPDYPLRAWCHDAFLSAWAEGGPLLAAALAAWFALLARAFLRLRRVTDALGRAACAAALAGLAALFVNALVHDVFWSTEPMLAHGFLFAVCVALARNAPASATAPPGAREVASP